jgi:hypothetical protein
LLLSILVLSILLTWPKYNRFCYTSTWHGHSIIIVSVILPLSDF